MLKTLKIIFLNFALISCQSEQEKLIGHWHEFMVDSSNKEFNHCFIITDSTIAVDKFTFGGIDKFSDYENANFWVSTLYPEDLIKKRVIKKDKVIFGDTLIWKRQQDNLETFIADFSANLWVDIYPFESKTPKFDFNINDKPIGAFIYVGKLKSSAINMFEKYSSYQYYIQLNDRIGSPNGIIPFLLCNHCEMTKTLVFIHADRDTPKELLSEIEYEMSQINISKEQIYYLTINTAEFKYGYNHNY